MKADKASLHAKFFAFDRAYLFIGSFNLDARSAKLNTEPGACFRKPEEAANLAAIFERDIMQFAYRVQLDGDGELQWSTLDENGREVVVEHEPDTDFWDRFGTRILSPIVPESEL